MGGLGEWGASRLSAPLPVRHLEAHRLERCALHLGRPVRRQGSKEARGGDAEAHARPDTPRAPPPLPRSRLRHPRLCEARDAVLGVVCRLLDAQ